MDDHARGVGWTCAAQHAFHARREDRYNRFTTPVGTSRDCAGTPSEHRGEIVFRAGMDRPHPITSRRALYYGVFRAYVVADDSWRSSSTKRAIDRVARVGVRRLRVSNMHDRMCAPNF